MSSDIIVVGNLIHAFPSIFKNLADIPAIVLKESKAIRDEVIILAAGTLDHDDSVIVAAVSRTKTAPAKLTHAFLVNFFADRVSQTVHVKMITSFRPPCSAPGIEGLTGLTSADVGNWGVVPKTRRVVDGRRDEHRKCAGSVLVTSRAASADLRRLVIAIDRMPRLFRWELLRFVAQGHAFHGF